MFKSTSSVLPSEIVDLEPQTDRQRENENRANAEKMKWRKVRQRRVSEYIDLSDITPH